MIHLPTSYFYVLNQIKEFWRIIFLTQLMNTFIPNVSFAFFSFFLKKLIIAI